MIVIGVLLILLAALFLVLVLVGGSEQTLEFGLGLGSLDLTATGIFLLGAATVLIFVSGLELLRSGLRRSMRRRRELKQARAVVADHDRREQPATSEQTSAGPTSTSSTGSETTGSTTATESPDPSTHETSGGTDAPGSTRDR
ncbi:MAG: hypothetical protein M3211_03735 [Actinomycetota bacterium]|nr:hypothetical protein [Actinomycetota bacterium]